MLFTKIRPANDVDYQAIRSRVVHGPPAAVELGANPHDCPSAGDLGVFRIANIPGVPNPTSTDPQGSRSNNQGVPDQFGADLWPQVLPRG